MWGAQRLRSSPPPRSQPNPFLNPLLQQEAANDSASLEGEKALAKAKADIELEGNRARDQLRGQVVSLAVAGAKRVLEREVDAKTHGELLDQLAAKL